VRIEITCFRAFQHFKLLNAPYCWACLPSLNELIIKGKCNQHLLSSIHKLSSLESLQFIDNEKLTCFPDGMLWNLTSLKFFDICGLSKLKQLPTEISSLNVIQEIDISRYENLKSLTDEVSQGLHSLKILNIMRCHKFNPVRKFSIFHLSWEIDDPKLFRYRRFAEEFTTHDYP
jgi:hypothetical protein